MTVNHFLRHAIKQVSGNWNLWAEVKMSGIAVVALGGVVLVLVIAIGAAFFVLTDMWLDPDPVQETNGALPDEEEA